MADQRAIKKSPIRVYDVVRMIGESLIIRGDLSARADDDGFDNAVKIDDSDNVLDGCWSAGESDRADILEGYQIAKDKSQTWIKGQSRKRQSEILVEALTDRIRGPRVGMFTPRAGTLHWVRVEKLKV